MVSQNVLLSFKNFIFHCYAIGMDHSIDALVIVCEEQKKANQDSAFVPYFTIVFH